MLHELLPKNSLASMQSSPDISNEHTDANGSFDEDAGCQDGKGAASPVNSTHSCASMESQLVFSVRVVRHWFEDNFRGEGVHLSCNLEMRQGRRR